MTAATVMSEWTDVGDGDLTGDVSAVHATESEFDGGAACGHEVAAGERIVLTDGGWVCAACASPPGTVRREEVTTAGRGVRDDQPSAHTSTSQAVDHGLRPSVDERLPNVQTGDEERGGESGFPADPSLSSSPPTVADAVFERTAEKPPRDWAARYGVVIRIGSGADGRGWVEALNTVGSRKLIVHRLYIDELDPALTRPASAAIATEMARRICAALGRAPANLPFTPDDVDHLYIALALLHDHAGAAA